MSHTHTQHCRSYIPAPRTHEHCPHSDWTSTYQSQAAERNHKPSTWHTHARAYACTHTLPSSQKLIFMLVSHDEQTKTQIHVVIKDSLVPQTFMHLHNTKINQLNCFLDLVSSHYYQMHKRTHTHTRAHTHTLRTFYFKKAFSPWPHQYIILHFCDSLHRTPTARALNCYTPRCQCFLLVEKDRKPIKTIKFGNIGILITISYLSFY